MEAIRTILTLRNKGKITDDAMYKALSEVIIRLPYKVQLHVAGKDILMSIIKEEITA